MFSKPVSGSFVSDIASWCSHADTLSLVLPSQPAGRHCRPDWVASVCLVSAKCDGVQCRCCYAPGSHQHSSHSDVLFLIKFDSRCYYYNRFTTLCPGLLVWVSTGRINHSGFCWSRDDRVAVASAEPYASYLHFAAEDNHAITSSLKFLRAGCSSWHPANSIKALKAETLDASLREKLVIGCIVAIVLFWKLILG